MLGFTNQVRKLNFVTTQAKENILKLISWEMKIIGKKSPKLVVSVFLAMFPTPHR